MWVKSETLFPFNISVSLDLLLINILEAQGLNTIYTLINRQGFEHRGWVGGVDFISQGTPPPILSPEICIRKSSLLLAVQIVSECP